MVLLENVKLNCKSHNIFDRKASSVVNGCQKFLSIGLGVVLSASVLHFAECAT